MKSPVVHGTRDSKNTAKYVELHNGAVPSVGIENLLEELRINPEMPQIYKANNDARVLVMNGIGQKQLGYLEIKHYFAIYLGREER